MTTLVAPDPMTPGRFMVAVQSLAGLNVVGGRLIRSTAVRFPEKWPMNLSAEEAEELADQWQDALDEQAGRKVEKLRKRKVSKVQLKEWDQATHPESR
jgi:hypothetical protein